MSTQHSDEEFKKAPSKQTKKAKLEKSKRIQNQTLLKIVHKNGKGEKSDLANSDNDSGKLMEKVQEVQKLLNFETMEPDVVIKQLVDTYENQPGLFLESINNQKGFQKSKPPLIFFFIQRVVEYYYIFPFDKKRRVFDYFDDLNSYLHQTKELSWEELLQLEKINETIWKESRGKEIDQIIRISSKKFLHISIELCKRERKEQEQMIFLRMVKEIFKGMISALERNHEVDYFKSLISNYLNDIFLLFDSASNRNVECLLPIFDLAVLSFSSAQHQKFYQKIVQMIFDYLKQRLEEKKEEKSDTEELSQQEYQKTLKILLVTSKILNFHSIFETKADSFKQKVVFSQQKIILVLVNNKKNIIKVLDELQKFGKGNIPEKTISQLFEMAAFCHSFDNKLYFQQVILSIMAKPKWRDYLRFEGICQNSTEQNIVAEVKNQLNSLHERIFFQILFRIESLLSIIDFQMYLEEYIHNPIFKRQKFIENMFNNSSDQVLLTFMVEFTQRWVLQNMKNFDFNHYLIIFLEKCVRTNNFKLFGLFIKLLEVKELLKINQIIFRISFEQDKKKFGLPESSNSDIQLAHLTSAGFADKYALVNKMFPQFSEQLVWKEIIRSLFSAENYNYIYVKTFYNVLIVEIDFDEKNIEKLNKIVEQFDVSIRRDNLEYICSIFHLLFCICFNQKEVGSMSHQIKKGIEKKVFEIVFVKEKEIREVSERIIHMRNNAIKGLPYLEEVSRNNINFSENMKKLNIFFQRGILKWIERIQNFTNMIDNRIQYEKVLNMEKQFAKDFEYQSQHLKRTLSNFCSDNYFYNTLQEKIKKKVKGNSYIFTNEFMYLREIILNLVGKYPEESINNSSCLSEEDILEYFLFVLNQKVEVARQRQQLKQKLLTLDITNLMVEFFMKNDGHRLETFFEWQFLNELKETLVAIALHSPELIGKYEKELILHLRLLAIKLIVKVYRTKYEILGGQNIFGFFLELCVDKSVEIRLFILNLMSSRFKSDEYKAFLSNKYRIASFLTILSIFEPTVILQKTSRRILETIKKSSDENNNLGFIVLIYSVKMVFNDILKSLVNKEDQYMYLDTFIKGFDEIWMVKREWQYVTYSFIDRIFENKNIQFVLDNLEYTRFGTARRSISRQKEDIRLEVQIKSKYKGIDFQFPPDEVPDIDYLNIIRAMEDLQETLFQKLKQLIIEKARGTRTLKGKKDFLIHWEVLTKEGLIKINQGKRYSNPQ